MVADDKQKEAIQSAYEECLKEFSTNVVTWSDMYETIHRRMREFKQCHCATHAMDALYPMYAFILALEALPEEGDIKVIGERMATIMTYDALDKLGAEVMSVTPEQVREASRVVQALTGRGLFGNGPEEPEDATTPATTVAADKKHLH